jgi:hypothetical protein
MAPILTISARVALATYVKARTAHLAWGAGDVAWGSNPPAPAPSATALVAEIARRKATLVDYCAPDASGDISVPEGKFAVSATPTRNLYFKFHFEFDEGIGATIRETAIFLDTVMAAGVPVGQFYLTPAQVAQPGYMLLHERRAPIVRQSTTRELFEFVVTF